MMSSRNFSVFSIPRLLSNLPKSPRHFSAAFIAVALMNLAGQGQAASPLMITEFLASSSGKGTNSIKDEDGAFSPWVEIYNTSATAPVNLNGYFLTHSTNNLTEWRIPNVVIPPNDNDSYFIIFLSGKDRTNVTSPLHANFQLNKAGDYLALVDPKTNVISDFFPQFPPQQLNVSYGRDPIQPSILEFFTVPTPGNPNFPGGPGFEPEVQFSAPSGTYSNAFNLQLSVSDPTALIRYTLSSNTIVTSTNLPSSSSLIYTNPIPITNSVMVRARAFSTNLSLSPGPLRSQGYFMLSSNALGFTSELPILVLHTFNGGGFPDQTFQFAFLEVFEPKFGRSALTNPPDLTTVSGIHNHGSSTAGDIKHNIRLTLFEDYFIGEPAHGANERKVPLLELPADSDWILYGIDNFDPVQIHNQLAYELSNEMGRYASRTRACEVFWNTAGGLLTAANYNGTYVLEERIKISPERVNINKMKQYDNTLPAVTGGYRMSVDRPVTGPTGTEPQMSVPGEAVNILEPKYGEISTPQRAPQFAYLQNYMTAFGNAVGGPNFLNPLTGFRAYVDVDAAVDHHVHNTFTFNIDALRLSAYFSKPRNGPLIFGPSWDFDRTQGSTDGRDFNPRVWRAKTGDLGTDMFHWPWWGPMFMDIDFWQQWIDRYQQLRLTTFSTNNLLALIDRFTAELREAQARDVVKFPGFTTPRSGVVTAGDGSGYTFNFPGTYQGEVDFEKKWYLDRVNFCDTNFINMPTFSQNGGPIASGFSLVITGPSGTIYYTLNGADPRLPGGAISLDAQAYSGPIILTNNARVVARVRDPSHRNMTGASDNPPLSSPWSGPTAATFVVSTPPLLITEIMYNPAPPPPGSPYTAQDFQYIELQNTGTNPLFLGGIQFTSGIQFTFDAGQYAPTGAVTAQTFDGGGTPYTASTLAAPPGPAVTAGGPAGNFMRLIPPGGNTNRNRITFDQTAPGAHDRMLADFDFRGIDLTSAASAGAPTLQNFDVPGANYTLNNYLGTNLAAVMTNTAPTNLFMQLTPKATNDWNAIVFDSTATDVFKMVVANFDFRMTTAGTNKGLGMGFALLNTATYGTTGAASVPAFAEEPNLPNSIGVGFDIFQDGPGTPAEPNNNHISLHYNGAEVSPMAAIPSFTMANGQFHHAQVIIRFVGGNALVTVKLTPNSLRTPGPTETEFDSFVIPGVAPYAGRPAFGARTGIPFASHDLDNVDVEYFTAPGGLSFLLLPTATFGTTGAGAGLNDFIDEPALPGAFAIDLLMHPTSFVNQVAAYWNSNLVARSFIAPTNMDLDGGVFHHAHLDLTSSHGGATVNLTLTPDIFGTPRAPVAVFSDFYVAGLSPGDVRVELAGRAGELNLSVDLDNLNVQYEQFVTNMLAAGQSLVLVENIAAFQSRYGTNILIGGQYSGALAAKGERLALVGGLGEPILDFSYDPAWYPITAGYGFSLSLVNQNAPLNTWGDPASWRPSAGLGGSPGLSNPPPIDFPPILVNEVLANPIPPARQKIELYNPSANAANLGGWFITDDPKAPQKFRIPDGAVIAAGGYLVFDDTAFNPTPGVGASFAFNRNGEQADIFSADAGGNLTGYIQGFPFGASDTGVSFGRYVVSTGDSDFTAQTANTFGAVNAGPSIGPLVISEIMYHPPDLFLNGNFWDDTLDEYVELQNVTGAFVPLFDPAFPANTWALNGGIQFRFPPGVTLPPNGFLLVVSFDPVARPLQLAAFQNRYGVSASVPVLGPYSGSLSNTLGDLQLFKPRGPDAGLVPQVLVDRVKYRDAAPWPIAADGIGPSLQRLNSAAYGNDPTNWVGALPTPGAPYGGGAAPVISAQPLSQTAVQYLNTSFTVVATGNGPLSYQWRFKGSNLVGATNTILVLTNVQPANAGDYIAVIMNPANSLASAPATLTVLKVPTIISPPVSVSIAPSNNVTFTVVAASDHPPLTYQWRLNGVSLPGQTSNTLMIPNVQLPLNGNSYDVVITDQIGSVTSLPVLLTVLVKPIFLSQPLSQTVLVGDTVSFSVAVTGTPPFGYKWVGRQTNGSTRLLANFGQGLPTITLTNLQLTNTGTYTVSVTNVATPFNSPVTSVGAFLTVLADSDHDGMPDVWELAYGFNPNDPSDANIDSDGDGMTNLQEYIAGTNPLDPTSYLKIDTISGAPSATTLLFNAVSNKTYSLQFKESLTAGVWTKFADVVAGTNTHEVSVLDPYPPGNSRLYRLAVPQLPSNPPGPAILTSPQSLTVSAGSPASFSVLAAGTGSLTYQWLLNGNPVAGANAPALLITSAQASNAGAYTVMVSDQLGSTTSQPAVLTVK